MSSVTSATSTTPAISTDPNVVSATAAAASKTLSTADFLQLLTTEMNNQDPLQPMDDTASMAQLAQFSSLDAMNTLSQNFGLMRADQSKYTAASYIGMQVTVTDSTSASGLTTGIVSAVDTSSDTPQLEINGNNYPLSTITKVESPSTATTTTPTS
jgi:flagellar basal-body rod modification protein FlgD